ncbi:MAG: serine/threonine-protein kinase [Planctomycetaceae bacterium]
MNPESRYELLEKIGSGSFATVYRARDLELGREVAVKQIHQEYLADPATLERYWQEAQLLASLAHPNIVTVYDVHREQGWLIMELMQTNLADRMRGRQMDVRALKTTVAHSLRALKYLHSRGIVHGDLKPANLMIDARKRVKLGDFGLARRVSDEEGSLLKGTTKYMAPEVVSDEFGEVGPASDLYSLGFAAYDLLCGPNFEDLFPGLSAFGRNKQVAWMMWHAAPDRRLPEIARVMEGVPEDLAHVIQKLCEKDQTKRYKSADEALADLNVDQKVVRVGETPAEQPAETDPGEAARKKRLLLIGGAFAFSVLLSLAMLFMSGGGDTDGGGGEGVRSEYAFVRSVDPENSLIHVEDVDDRAADVIRLVARPSIYLMNDKRTVRLDTLQRGDRLKIEEYETVDGKVLVKRLIVTRPVTNFGRIERVDLEGSTIAVRLTEGGADTLEVRIPPLTAITINEVADNPAGRAFSISDLRVGDSVELRHLDELEGRTGRVADRIAVDRASAATGFVEGYDPVDAVLRVRPFAAGPRPEALALAVDSEAVVTLREEGAEERIVRPHDLRPNDRVRVVFDTRYREVAATRTPQVLHGAVVREVREEDDGTRVVVQQSDGAQSPVSLAAAADVTLGAEPAALVDLRPYDKAWIGYAEPATAATPPPYLLARTFDAARPENPNRWAVLIGIGSQRDQSVSSLPWAMPGAERLRDALVRRYAVPENRLRLLLDEPRRDIERQLEDTLASVRPQAQLIVYVACRALVADDGQVYLAGVDFDSNRHADTGIPLSRLIERIDQSSSPDKLLLLDLRPASSRGDSAATSLAEKIAALEPPRSTAIIAAASPGETALDLPQERATLFAHALAEGFRGPADADRDLHITPAELIAFLRARMRETAPAGATQTPALIEPRE